MGMYFVRRICFESLSTVITSSTDKFILSDSKRCNLCIVCVEQLQLWALIKIDNKVFIKRNNFMYSADV